MGIGENEFPVKLKNYGNIPALDLAFGTAESSFKENTSFSVLKEKESKSANKATIFQGQELIIPGIINIDSEEEYERIMSGEDVQYFIISVSYKDDFEDSRTMQVHFQYLPKYENFGFCRIPTVVK